MTHFAHVAIALTVLLTVSIPTIVWLITTRRRHLPAPETILSNMAPHTPGLLDDIRPFAEAGEAALFAEDGKFIEQTGGRAGIRARRKRAVLIMQFTQTLVLGKTLPEDQVRFMMQRSFLISLLAIPGMPLLCTRIGAILYMQMCARIITICEDLAPNLVQLLYVGL